MKNKKAKEKFTEEVVKQLLTDYQSKVSLKDLKKKYSAGSETIYKLLAQNGIQKTNSKDLSKFYDLTNKELQY